MGKLTFETIVCDNKIAVEVAYNFLNREEYEAVVQAVKNFLVIPLKGVDVSTIGIPATPSKPKQ